jgi:hypothetical protein
MAIKILVVRLSNGSEANLVYEMKNGTSRLLPYHLAENNRPAFSLLDVVERLRIIDLDRPDGESGS